MKSIEKVKLANVLSHKDTEVEVGRRLTVFTGPSDSGKSSVMRGLCQLFENRPAGINLISHKAKRGEPSATEVWGRRDDGAPFCIARIRSASRNEYEVDGTTLKAFGAGVPEEVVQIANLSEHAFQHQSGGHFLLSSTAGEVARVIGHTVGLEQIDSAFDAVRKRKSANDADLREAQNDLAREQAEMEKFDGFDRLVEINTVVSEVGAAVDKADAELGTASTFRDAMRSTPESVDVVPLESALKSADMVARECDVIEARIGSAKALLCGLETLPCTEDLTAVRCVVDDYGRVSGDAVQRELLWSDADKLLDEFAGIPEERSLVLRTHRLVGELDAAVDVCERIFAVLSDASRLIGGLRSVKSIPRVEVSRVGNLISGAGAVRDAIANTRKTYLEAFDRCQALLSVCEQSGVLVKEAECIKQEIERYREAHNVCPECGAEQKHWAAN